MAFGFLLTAAYAAGAGGRKGEIEKQAGQGSPSTVTVKTIIVCSKYCFYEFSRH
jgi:hypothetical protein